jgi:hypothetical protein
MNKGTKLMNRKSGAIKVEERALTLNVQHLKFQVSAMAAGALLNLNADCRTMSFFFYETDVH